MTPTTAWITLVSLLAAGSACEAPPPAGSMPAATGPSPTATSRASAATMAASASAAAPEPAITVVEGAAAPDVELALHDGKKLKLSSLHGQLVLLYFYPKDDTPGCTVEAQGLRDGHQALTKAGVTIFGVSTQDASSHQAFIDKHDLPFSLVVDDGTIARAFEVPLRGGLAARQSFLVGKDGKLVKVWRQVDPASHADEVLKTASGSS